VLEKRSLNEYLKANNLPLKLEVSFDDMNSAFKELVDRHSDYDSDHENDDTLTLTESLELSGLGVRKRQAMNTLNRIYEYCVYDSDACRLLWGKRNLVFQQMEVCKLSHTPLRAGFMNANGIKVRNMVASFAHDRGYAVPMSTTSHDVRLRDTRLLDKYEKYPGAYVPEPHKGVSLTPVIALDFASLYPSIIMAHNLSPENVIEDADISDIKYDHSALYSLVTLKNGQ
jgi:DNA polymerase delta subunit 1